MDGKEKAVSAAIAFLAKQSYKGKYDLQPARIVEHSAFWEIFFRKKIPGRPNECCIGVNKHSGRAELVPLR